MLRSPLIGPTIGSGYAFLHVLCSGCRTCKAIDLRPLGRHPDAAAKSLIQSLSCRNCRPNAPFVTLLGLSYYDYKIESPPDGFEPYKSR